MKIKEFLNRGGFSLVEVMVAAGVASVMALGLTRLIDDQGKSVKRIQTSIEADSLADTISEYFVDQDVCNDSVGGINANTGEVTVIRKGASTYFNVANFNANSTYLDIQRIELRDPTVPSDPWDFTTAPGTFPADLAIVIRKLIRSRDASGNLVDNWHEKTYLRPMIITVDGSFNVVDCNTTNYNTMKATCEALGGVMNGAVCENITPKIGDTTCNASNEGKIRYDSTNKLIEFCNGTAWTAPGASPEPSPGSIGGEGKTVTGFGGCAHCSCSVTWGVGSCSGCAGFSCPSGYTRRTFTVLVPDGGGAGLDCTNYHHKCVKDVP